MTERLEYHELANIFPLIQGVEFDELVKDIQWNGLQEPIILYEGKILDGRNRYNACLQANVEPSFVQYQGAEPLSFVVSLNLRRRHLSESQRAMVAQSVANLNDGQRRAKGGSIAPAFSQVSQPEAAEMLNVSRESVKRAAKVAKSGDESLIEAVEQGQVSVSAASDLTELPKEEQKTIVLQGEEEVLKKAKEIRQQRSDLKRKERLAKIFEISKGNSELPTDKLYPIIYADPPWRYEHSETDSRKIENHYPTMTLDDICALSVPTTDDAILFLWGTSPKLEEAMLVLQSWGFTYRTCAVWDKQKIGMGYYFRQQHELLLIATKGSFPAPAPENRPPSVFYFERGEHSAKPHEVAEIIEKMYPELPKLEMFCRSAREGWTVWGNQSDT